MKVVVTQSCLTLCDTVEWSPPGSFVHGILQARILARVAMPFSRGSNPGLPHCRQILYHLNYLGSLTCITACFQCFMFSLVNPKGNKSWIFIGRTDAEAEAPILWPLDAKSWLFRKDPDAGKDWRKEEKGTTEEEMVGWHHQLNGLEF